MNSVNERILTWVKVEVLQASPDEETRKLVAAKNFFDNHYVPTPDQVERGLTDPSAPVRRCYAMRIDWTFSAKQIERGLADPDPRVRVAFYERRDVPITWKMVENELTDPSPVTRAYCICNLWDYDFAAAQIERALVDADSLVRYWAVSRFSDVMSPAQIERSLTDEDQGVRLLAIDRFGNILTPEQIERAKPDTDEREELLHQYAIDVQEILTEFDGAEGSEM